MLHLAQQLAHFLRFCHQIGWPSLARQGDRQADLVQLVRCFSGNSELTGQLGGAVSLCRHKEAFAANRASRGALKLPNACQGPPKQDENIGNSMVWARCPFSLNVVLSVDPLAKLRSRLTQTGVQWAPRQGRQSSKMDAKATHGTKP